MYPPVGNIYFKKFLWTNKIVRNSAKFQDKHLKIWILINFIILIYSMKLTLHCWKFYDGFVFLWPDNLGTRTWSLCKLWVMGLWKLSWIFLWAKTNPSENVQLSIQLPLMDHHLAQVDSCEASFLTFLTRLELFKITRKLLLQSSNSPWPPDCHFIGDCLKI